MIDLTYVRVKQSWHYICVLVDLYNREIIGYSAGPNKSAELVQRAFSTVKHNLNPSNYSTLIEEVSLKTNKSARP